MADGMNGSGELPPEWAFAFIDDFSDHCLGKMLDGGKKRLGNALPYLRNINVRWGTFDLEELYEMPFETSELRRYGIEDGDVLVCEGGEPGRCAVWRGGPTQIKLQKALHRLRCLDGISPEFIALQLRYLAINDRLSSHFTGTTIKHLPGVALKQVRFKIAPAAEQRRIVAKIDELFGEIEAGEQELEKAREGLEAYRRAVLKAAVTGELTREWREKNAPNETGADLLRRILTERRAAWERMQFATLIAKGQKPSGHAWKTRYIAPWSPDPAELPDLPHGWIWASMDQLLTTIEAGKSFKCEERPPESGEVGIVKVSSVTWGDFNEHASKTITDNARIERSSQIHEGDFLLSRANTLELVGAPAIVQSISRTLLLSDKVLRLRLAAPFEGWLYHVLRSPWGRQEIESRSTGNQLSMRNITQESIRRIRIPLPPPHELRELEILLSDQLALTAETRSAVRVHMKEATRLRQSILAAAFSGNLVAQDPADEPASILLERLRAAKASGNNLRLRRGRSPSISDSAVS
jgi:type I restriction enzyme, S subunit